MPVTPDESYFLPEQRLDKGPEAIERGNAPLLLDIQLASSLLQEKKTQPREELISRTAKSRGEGQLENPVSSRKMPRGPTSGKKRVIAVGEERGSSGSPGDDH